MSDDTTMLPLHPLIAPVAAAAAGFAPFTVAGGAALLKELLAAARAIPISDREVPFGRYLIHADPAGRFNLQLDVFSRGYTGGVHAHDTWGMFLILRGALTVEDWQEIGGEPVLCRSGYMGAGGGQAFGPPWSDWHRVSTDRDGPQTVSVHIYGAGFDLDTGRALDENGKPRLYRRGAFGDPSKLAGLF